MGLHPPIALDAETLSTPPKSIWQSLPTRRRSCHSLAPDQPALAAGLPRRSQPGTICNCSCPRTRRDELNLISLLHADLLHSLASVRGAKLFCQLFHKVHIAGGSCEKCHRKLQISRRELQIALPPLAEETLASILRGDPIRRTSRFQSAASPGAGPLLPEAVAVAWSARPHFLRFHSGSPLQAASSRDVRTAVSEWCRSPHVLTTSSTASVAWGLPAGPTGATVWSLAGLGSFWTRRPRFTPSSVDTTSW